MKEIYIFTDGATPNNCIVLKNKKIITLMH